MDLEQFDYELPDSLIAQHPLEKRTDSRLLVAPRGDGQFRDMHFDDLLELVDPGDLLVVNDSRVVPARLYARKPTGGKVEMLLERVEQGSSALVMLKSSKPLGDGQQLLIGKHVVTITARRGTFFQCQFPAGEDVMAIFEELGSTPLPPYIRRQPGAEDPERYQTVYSRSPGAVAAPTAGLHFEQLLIDDLLAKGVFWSTITLHVGAGTFQPVRQSDITSHVMHAERVQVSAQTCENIKQARARGSKVIAVGTTVVRALESAAQGGKLSPMDSDTSLFIYPGYGFNVVDALVTNFHLPKSTLLMMVSAFAGYEKIMECYQYAIENDYRFYSYGDAMFVGRK